MHRNASAWTLVIALLVVPLAGCAAPSDGEGSASVYVKDAPTDEFAEIHVVFTQALIHAGNTSGNNSGEWITVADEPSGIDIDLLNTTGTRAALLGEANLTAGTYTQIRLTVSEAYGIDHDGNRTAITVSSGTIKVVRSFEIVEGEESRIVIDIDLDKSVRQQGQGSWRMTPVVGKTSVEQVDDAESGADADEVGEPTDL